MKIRNSFQKYLFVLAVILMLLGTQACNLGAPGFQEPPPGEPPPGEPPPEPQPQNPPGDQCQSNFETDIAITDIYAGNLPHGQVHIRIANLGPCTLQNVKDDVYCFADITDHNTNKVSHDSKTVRVVYNMSPGEEQTFPTDISLDTNTFDYKVNCNLQPGKFKELNSNNNSITGNIP